MITVPPDEHRASPRNEGDVALAILRKCFRTQAGCVLREPGTFLIDSSWIDGTHDELLLLDWLRDEPGSLYAPANLEPTGYYEWSHFRVLWPNTDNHTAAYWNVRYRWRYRARNAIRRLLHR